MGGTGALLAPEIDFGIAVLVSGAGHRIGLGKCGFGRGIRGGRIAWPALMIAANPLFHGK
jgi:hypothetical protein